MDMFDGGVRVSMEEAVRIAELTDVDSCDEDEASKNFGRWLRIYDASLPRSILESYSLAKIIRLADRDNTKEDRNRRIIRWQTILARVPAGSKEEELAAQKVITELKRLKKELKSEKSSG